MISKDQLRELIDHILSDTGKTQEEIALGLGYGKNYISEMLSPTGKVSTKFVNSLKLKHAKSLEIPNKHDNAPSNSLQPDSATQTPEVRNYASLMEERLKELKEDKEWLKRNFEFSLTGLVVGQRSILAHVETILEKDNERDAAGNTMKEKDLKDDVNRRIAEKMVVGAKKDIQANTG